MQTQASKFRITREDLQVDPVTLVTDGLKIGRLPNCELVLNHPTVSRLHAGITLAGRRYYLYNFSSSSGTTLNGRVVATESGEVLADGDVVQVGPFLLGIEREGDTLGIVVTLEVAATAGDFEGRGEAAQHGAAAVRPGEEPTQAPQALNVFWEKRKREAGKMQRVSPLRPQKPMRVLGKARFNWTPTRDLVRPWPLSVFVWGFAAVALLSVVAAYVYADAYAPAPVSAAHAAPALSARPAIAARVNASACTSCHTLTASIDSNCASCHQAAGFRATVTEPHARAGVGCTDCHVEHQGTEFRPAVASLQTCANCHSDDSTKTFGGRRLGAPHGGGYGYPVAGGRWTWKGLTDEEWRQKSAPVQRLVQGVRESPTAATAAAVRDPSDARRSAEFHALHLHRVRAVGGLPGNREGEVSCSTCHKNFDPIDRETPRQTCGTCHDGDRGGKFEKVLAPDRPNCISCHVQHPLARRAWGGALLNDLSAAPPDFGEAAPPR